MGTRSNPFYRYQNPALGQGFSGLAAAMFPQPDKTQSEIAAREAQAAANMALAAERDQNTRGKTIKNDRYDAMPTELAQLFMSGGRFQDEPLTSNPLYQPPAPIDYGAMMRGEPIPQEAQPMMLGGRTATDQFATALQQMEAYGFRPDQIMDAIGRMEYLNRAAGADPQAALPFAPFAGVTSPNANTALTPDAQNQISARNAQESLTQATQVEDMRNKNRIDIENIREDGRVSRGTSGGRTPALPTVTPRLTADMRTSLEQRVKAMGYANVEPGAIDELTRFATQLYQDPNNEDTFKNSAESVFATLDMLESGQMAGVSETLRKNFFGRPRRDLNRVPASERPAQNESPSITAARAAIAQGAPRDAVIKRLKDNGITPPKDL